MQSKDCLSATYTYNELVTAYDQFITPAVSITIGSSTDNVISQKGLAIDSIQVSLSSDSAASLSFQIVNAFDITSHSFKADVKETFAVGKIISASLGYGSDLTKIFKGYIKEYRTSYQDVPTVSITAVDFRSLLMKNKRLNYNYQQKSYSEIFTEVIGNYKDLYDKTVVDATTDKVDLIQNNTDHHFIKESLCQKANQDFFVIGGTVYFKKRETKTPFLELEWGKNLISFQKSTSYCHEKVKAYSSQNDKTGIVESGDLKTSDDTTSLTQEDIVEEREVEAELDAETLKKMIKQEILEKKEENEMANGSVIGLPEIVPGRYIKIKGVDSNDEETYYIKSVNHSFGSDGFNTSFSIGKEEKWNMSEGDIQKQVAKKCNGIMRAKVKENWNEEKPGKVLVEFLSGEEGKKTTKWLPVVQPYTGNGYGNYFHPEVGTEVVVISQMGNVNNLMVIGSMWNEVDLLPANTANEKNTVKRIKTKGNHELIFDDDEENGKVELITKGKLHIALEDKEKIISVLDETGKNGLIIDAKNEMVQILAGKKVSIKVGDKEMLLLDGSGDSVSIKAGSIEEEADKTYQLKSKQMVTDASQTEIKGSSITVNGSGMTEIKGSMVKIN